MRRFQIRGGRYSDRTGERFYDFDRPHGAFAGQTPYEARRERLQS